MSHAFGSTTTAQEVVGAFPDRVNGRVFLVTGPSPNGIGAAALTALAGGHPTALLLVGRNPAKYAPVVDAIRAVDPKVVVRVYGIDLGSIQSVREGAKKIIQENEHIDVLINSAGVGGIEKLTYTQDGIEEMFATNHVGHFLLTNLLIPMLKRSAEPRVVIVSSGVQARASGDYSDYNFKSREYEWHAAYAQSKLANVHLTLALAKRGINAITVSPGFIGGTSLLQNVSHEDVRREIERRNIQVKTPDQGASTTVVAALDPKGAEWSGKWLNDCQVAELKGEGAQKEGAAEELWKLSEKLVGEEFAL